MSNTQPTTKYTITAAHRITGKSRTTLQRHLKSGKLSCTEDHDGNRIIDASKLIRVYGDACDFSHEEQAAANPEKREQGSSDSLDYRLESVQQRLGAGNSIHVTPLEKQRFSDNISLPIRLSATPRMQSNETFEPQERLKAALGD